MTRVDLYARYSSDNQSAASIEREVAPIPPPRSCPRERKYHPGADIRQHADRAPLTIALTDSTSKWRSFRGAGHDCPNAKSRPEGRLMA